MTFQRKRRVDGVGEDGAGIRNGAQRGVLGNVVGGKKVKVVGEVVFEHEGEERMGRDVF